MDVINLGPGDPDVVPPERLRKLLARACLEPDSHHYPSFYSQTPLKEAMAGWYERRFGLLCDPQTEVLPLLGSAEGPFHIHSSLLDVGDTALTPDPSYPAYLVGVAVAGGLIERVPLLEENGFQPELDAIEPEVAERARLIRITGPNNPTLADAPPEFFERRIEWARRYHVTVISDNPYSEICFDGYHAPSFLQLNEAKEVGMEFNSLSKA